LTFFFVIRLFGITNPPLENSHDWRQCLTNMVSRNLYETDNNLLYPRVDNGGRHEGIMASEFPIYNYLVYLISIVFGYDHWYGRLINLIISTLAGWFFYKLVKMYFTRQIAFNATLILTVSIWFSFSRKTMPDVFSVSLMIIALYHAFSFTKNPKTIHLLAYGISGSLAVLAKIPALYALSLLALPILSTKVPKFTKGLIIITSFALFAIMYWWYFVWGNYLLKTWQYQLFFPKNFTEGIAELKQYPGKLLEQFYFTAFQSFIAFAVFLFGLIVCIIKRFWLPLKVLAVSFPVFLAFIIKTGNVFALHSYYVIPFVPVMALIAGIGLYFIPKKAYVWIICFIAIEAIANQQHDFFVPDSEKFKLGLEQEINTYVPLNEKIALTGTTGPQYLYFAHRKGWGLSPQQTTDTVYMNEVKSKGYKYLVIIKREVSDLPNYPKIAEGKNILVYDLR
jgi:hypothetical protein